MTDTKGNIRAKKTGSTGITEDILKKIADAGGGHLVAIVELKADEIHEKVDSSDRKVDFVIDTIEPVVDGKLDGALVDHVRDIQRALFRNRKLAEDGPQLPMPGDADEPTVEGVLAARAALLEDDDEGPKLFDPDDQGDDPANPDDPAYDPHPYIEGPEGDSGCLTCDQDENSPIHSEAPVHA